MRCLLCPFAFVSRFVSFSKKCLIVGLIYQASALAPGVKSFYIMPHEFLTFFQLLTLPFPHIDPVAFEIGPFVFRWYALAYLIGIILAWRYSLWLVNKPLAHEISLKTPSGEQLDNFVSWAVIGIIIGGRLGYVVFYNPSYYLENPLESFAVWKGGMSFHGGLIGVIAAIALYTRRQNIALPAFTDIIACAVPIGLLLGRIANFINAELYGRPSDVPWAMVFPGGGDAPRHPSQLYEAGLEGLLLFVILYICVRRGALKHPGLITGLFLTLYGLARIFVELFREPDVQIGFLSFGTTMGQWLSLPLVIVGVYIVSRAVRHRPASSAYKKNE